MSDFIQEYLKNRSPTYKKAVETATSANMIEDIMKAHGGQMAGNASSIGSAMLNSGHAPLMAQGMQMLSKAQEIDAKSSAAFAANQKDSFVRNGTIRIDGVAYDTVVNQTHDNKTYATVSGHQDVDNVKMDKMSGRQFVIDANGGKNYLVPVGTKVYGGQMFTPDGQQMPMGGTRNTGFGAANRPTSPTGKGHNFIAPDATEGVVRENKAKTYPSVQVDENGRPMNPYRINGMKWKDGSSAIETPRGVGGLVGEAMEQEYFAKVKAHNESMLKKKSEWDADYIKLESQLNSDGQINQMLSVLEESTHHFSVGIAAELQKLGKEYGGVAQVPLNVLDPGLLESHMLPVKGRVALDTLLWLRDSSKTGAGMGNTSDGEMAMLQNSIAALNTAQTVGQLYTSYQMIRDVYSRRAQQQHDQFESYYGVNLPTWKPQVSWDLKDAKEKAFDRMPTIAESEIASKRQAQEQAEAYVYATKKGIGWVSGVIKNLFDAGRGGEIDAAAIAGLANTSGLPVSRIQQEVDANNARGHGPINLPQMR